MFRMYLHSTGLPDTYVLVRKIKTSARTSDPLVKVNST